MNHIRQKKASHLVREKKSQENVGEMDTRGQFHQHVYVHRSQNRKKTDDLTVFFTLLGSARAKAAQKLLMKLTPWVNFINTCALLSCILQGASLLVD